MRHNRKIIYLAGFLFSVPIGLVLYVNSSFLSLFVGERLAGIVFVLGSLSSILAVLIAPKIFKKIGGYKFLVLITFLDALSFLALVFLKNTWSVVIVFILEISLNTLIVFSLDELLKIFSRDSETGKIRGVYLTVGSLALILTQLAAGTILGAFSFRAFYFVSFLVMILFLVLCFRSLKNIPEPTYDKINSFKYVKNFFRNKNLSRAYILSFLVQFFYCWMTVYTPIYLYAYLGFSWKEIGIIFAIMLLPFLFMPVYMGRLADKVGERKILIFGFTVVALATLSLFFAHEQVLWLWAVLLFITRIGMATAESMSDTYFFKHIRPENEEWVGVYRTASPIAYIFGPLVAFIFLIFLPSFNYIYIVLGALMLYGVYLSSTIKRSDI